MKNKDREITITKLVWIFVIGSIAGYVLETSFYLLKHGVFMNKQGLLYGPIKPIYGIAACILSIILNVQYQQYVLVKLQVWEQLF